MKIEEQQETVDEIHNDVQGKVFQRSHAATELYNSPPHIVKPIFEVKDFVLVRWAHDRRHKLRFEWFGQKRITKGLRDWVYMAEDSHSSHAKKVHATCLIFY